MPRAKKSNNINKKSHKKGIQSPGVQVGAINPIKAKTAKRIQKQALVGMGASGVTANDHRNASMMLDGQSFSTNSHISSNHLSSYSTSYANGLNWNTATRDVPPYFVMMNEQNGGILYWPVTLREKYEMYRYFSRTDAYCGRALELLTDLPMSKISLNMPKMEDKPKELKEEIKSFYEGMCDHLNLFEKLQSMLHEYHLIGNTYIFHEWNEQKKMWDKIVLLPPEEVSVFQLPFSDVARVEYRPERLMSIIRTMKENGRIGTDGNEELMQEIYDQIPKEIVEMVTKNDCIIMDTDPSTGSFVYHLARNKSPYQDLGVSVLERVYVPMLMKEHFRYTQLGLASRNMTPKNKISAPNLTPEELADLRAQVDLSYLDPEFSIVTNYDWDWQQIGAEGRLLDLSAENEAIENQIFSGLGVTRELLTGEGVYSGTKITVEILNTMFLKTREVLQNYVEKQLFRPVAEAHGWYEVDKNGMKKYYYPKLGFNRLSIRDNQEVFDSLFQLYQKGSLPIDIIYELFNLNAEDIHDRIYSDLFTVKDPVFNRVLEEASTEAGRALGDATDLKKRVAKYLNLELVDEQGQPMPGLPDESLSPMQQKTKDRALMYEKRVLKNEPTMKEFNPSDIDSIAEEIAQGIDPNQDPATLQQTINQTVDEVIQ